MPGKNLDDHPIKDAEKKFTVEVHNYVMDTVIESMTSRFSNNDELLTDLALLSPIQFSAHKKKLPHQAFKILLKNILKFTNYETEDKVYNHIHEELISFSNNWKFLKMLIADEYEIMNWEIENDKDDLEVDSEKISQVMCKSYRNCTLCCYQLLIKYNLHSNAYQVLTVAYKYLLCLPVTQVACERYFSTLKYIKNRLRNKLSDENTEAFMSVSVEKEMLINIDNDEIIDLLSQKSKLLSTCF